MDSECSRRFTLLHVSDFHFRCGGQHEFDCDLVLGPLVEELKKIKEEGSWCPELVLCTGDIAFSGASAEYARAEAFFDNLLDAIDLERSRLFVVPGNHDVDLSKIDVAHRTIARSLSYRDHDEFREELLKAGSDFSRFLEIANRVFDDDEAFQGLLQKFPGYIEFTQSLGRPFGQDRHCFSELVQLESGLVVGIMGLNTAWLFAGKGKALEQMQQLMGMRPLLRACDAIKRQQEETKRGIDLTIVMYHHPLDWLYEGERGTIKATLGQQTDLLLEGHQDSPEQQFYEWVMPSKAEVKRTVVLQEGPAYDGSHCPNRIEFVRCEIGCRRKAIEVRSIVYDRPTRKWVSDSTTFATHDREDGHGHFPLWEASVERAPLAISHWDEFYNACHRFEDGRFYVLVVGDVARSSAQKSALGRVDWSMVLDFDPDTEGSGTYHEVRNELATARSLHLLTFDDQVTFSPERGTYWIAARGLQGRPSTLVEGEWRVWNRRFSQALRVAAQGLADSSGERPVTVVILWHKAEYIRTVCEAFDSVFRGSADFVLGTTYTRNVADMGEVFGAAVVPISLPDICNGLQQMIAPRLPKYEVAQLPSLDGSAIAIADETLRWVEEDFVVVHLGVGKVPETDASPGRDFLRGHIVSWFELAMHYDIHRDRAVALYEQVRSDLGSRSTRRISLYHWPGSGGTTVARRVAWDLHTLHPVVLLRKAISEETVGRLRAIYEATQNAVLVVVEGAGVSESGIDMLYSEVRSRPFPVVFLQVNRRFERRMRQSERVFFLYPKLNLAESGRFIQAYVREVPERRSALERVMQGENDVHRTPFYFGLVAFGRDFVALDNYVKRRLRTAGDVQKRIIVYIALVYHYAHRATPAQLFTKLLGLPDGSVVLLEQMLSEPLMELLVRESTTVWRPLHELIAKEILEQVLSGDAQDRRAWVQNLSAWAKDFAELCASRDRIPGEEVMDLLRRLYIYREQRELLGMEVSLRGRYAAILHDIPGVEGTLGVLRRLTELFPEEPHFWAHMARCYMRELKDEAHALQAIDRAITLSETDHVLYHIKGMIVGQQALDLMTECRRAPSSFPQASDEIRRLVEEAGEQFGKSRELAPPENEHGYVSHIDLLLRAADFAFSSSQADSRERFLASPSGNWYRELLDAAEGLIEDMERTHQGEERSVYFVGCESKLRQQYGDFTHALNSWYKLLGQRDVYQPLVRRQIARTYVAKAGRLWENLPQEEVDRVLSLMEENVRDEPVNDKNIRLWFRAARHSEKCTLEDAIERLAYWRTNSGVIDATFYLYILYVLQAIDGSVLARSKANDLISECSQKARARRYATRTNSIEWLGTGKGLKRLLHYRSLGEWDEEFERGERLALADGRVAAIHTPAAGELELSCGLRAFFVPSPRRGRPYSKARDENRAVEFYLAFSYDGLRAWSVRDA